MWEMLYLTYHGTHLSEGAQLASSPSQLGDRPFYGHWSLWDMLELKAEAFYRAGISLRTMRLFLDRTMRELSVEEHEKPADEATRSVVRECVGDLADACQVMVVPSTTDAVVRLTKESDKSCSYRRLKDLIRDVEMRLMDDLKRVTMLVIAPDKVHYYTEPFPFGEGVETAFPSTRDDIEAAGKCLALDQGTATVFHLIGVMEIGLRSLGRALSIPYAPNWESYLRQITKNMEIDHKKKPDNWKADEVFYRDLLGDLVAVKNAWRNPTVHVKRKYLPAEAEEVFRAVRTFMQRAATKLSDASSAPHPAEASEEQPS